MAVQGYVAAGPAGTSTPIRCPCRTVRRRSGRTRSGCRAAEPGSPSLEPEPPQHWLRRSPTFRAMDAARSGSPGDGP